MTISGDTLSEVANVKYLESLVQKYRGFDEDVKLRCEWIKWREALIFLF